jgi:sensor histidine kinase YesM
MISKISLKHKLFILLLIASVIPALLVNYSSQYYMIRSGTNYSATLSSRLAQMIAGDMDNYLKDIRQSIHPLVTNPDFQRFMLVPETDTRTKARQIVEFNPLLQSIINLKEDIVGILYLDRLGKVYFESKGYSRNFDYAFAKDPVYSKVFQMNKEDILPPHRTNYMLEEPIEVFSFVYPVLNLHTGSISSWLIVEIHKEKLLDLLSQIDENASNQAMLYNDANGTILSDNMQPDFSNGIRKSLNNLSSPSGTFVFHTDERGYQSAFRKLSLDGWTVVWLSPFDEMTKGIEESKQSTFIISLVSLLLAFIICFPLMRVTVRPLYRLKQGMLMLAEGIYQKIPYARKDEIGLLIQTYNKMLDDLKRLEKEVYEAKIKEKERELLQLQAQTNPHFIFNTMEAIEVYARKNNNQAVSAMIQSMSKMMRYNARNDSGWVELKEEIMHVRHFLTIHYYRNSSEIEAVFEVDDEVEHLEVLKLSIQPLVENAMKYGWSAHMKADQFRIRIQANIVDDQLRLSVQDTGAGFNPETLQSLIRFMRNEGNVNDTFFRNHTGLSNLYRRLLLTYGTGFSMEIQSESGNGSKVTIHIPIYDSGFLR